MLAFAIEVLLFLVSNHCSQILVGVATQLSAAAGGMRMSLIAAAEMAIRPRDSLLVLRIYFDKQLVVIVSEGASSSIPHWLCKKNSYISAQCHALMNFSAPQQHSNSRRHTDFETTLTNVDYLVY